MCGLVGVVSESPIDSIPDSAVDSLSHRGPDAHGARRLFSKSAYCWFGHTRLRVVDLSPEADQPLTNETGDIWIAYNGEIYNHPELRWELESAGHRFSSKSDTEIFVHLYEQEGGNVEAMLRRLRGMFAFALFDQSRGRLVLARDRLGIKPLYYSDWKGNLAFSSEVRTLARLTGNHRPNRDSAISYLLTGSMGLGRSTAFDGIQELPPGHFMVWEKGVSKVEEWWRPELKPVEELAEGAFRLMRGALADSVARHLVADRPVGLFLSAGTDSRSILRFASERGDVRSLTVSFPEAEEDEGELAARYALEAHASHESFPVTGADVANWFPQILSSMDQPTADGVNTWLACKAAKEAGLVVVLSGLGGDELFGGYPTFELVPRVATIQKILRAVPRNVRMAAAKRLSALAPGNRSSRVLTNVGGYPGAYEAVRGFFAPERDLGGLGVAAMSAESTPNGKRQDPTDQVMLLELMKYLPRQLLRDADSMSMSHSLEVRVPLLDDIMVDVALSMPGRVRNEKGKALLLRAAGLESSGPKRTFTLPFDQWLRGPLREMVREGLMSENLPFADLGGPDFRKRVWESFQAGRTHWSRPWSIAVLRLWPQANGFDW